MSTGGIKLDNSIWVSEAVTAIGDRIRGDPVVASVVVLGPVPYILSGLFITLAAGSEPASFLVGQGLAAIVPAIGPTLIWHYDENVFPRFVEEADDVVVDKKELAATAERYERFFARQYWLIAVPWTVLIVVAMALNIEYFKSLGVVGITDPAFIIYEVFAVWWSVISGIGLHGAVTTILCVRAVGDLDLEIDPLHPDGLGGLSTIGYFSIRATVMNSVGSFSVPIAFSIARRGGYESLVYIALGGYIGAILLSFIYPTIYVNRRAQEVRESVLREKRDQLRELQQDIGSSPNKRNIDDVVTQLKIQELRNDFHEYKNVNLYPLSISILTRLASSVLLPILFTVLETYVFSA